MFQQKCLSLNQVPGYTYQVSCHDIAEILLKLALITNQSINQSINPISFMKNTTCWKVPSTRGINFFLPPNARVALILYHKRSWLCSIVILCAAICAASSSGKPSSLTLWPSSYIKVIAVIRRIYIFTFKVIFCLCCFLFSFIFFHFIYFFILFYFIFYVFVSKSFVCVVFYFHLSIFFILFISLFYFIFYILPPK